MFPLARVFSLAGGGTSVIAGRIRAEGRFFVNDAGTFRPLFASALSILRPSRGDDAVYAYLNLVRETGFNGVRVFAGHLSWANQTAEYARSGLPALLAMAEDHGLYVEVTALTDTRDGAYDTWRHVVECARIAAAAGNCLLEISNEPGHSTQNDDVHDSRYLPRLYEDVRPSGVTCALGAPSTDELDREGRFTFPVADYTTIHLDRGREKWQQVRRVRELEAVSAVTGKPVMNNEPIGADESSQPGRRESDPAFFLALGALSRLFEVGAVFHSQDGLHAQPLGPVQQACAAAFVRGFRSLDTDARLSYQNAGWGDVIDGANWDHVVRAYAGIHGGAGYMVLVGLSGDPELQWKHGWHQTDVLAEMPGVQVLRIQKEG